MKRKSFTATINAPREKVWSTLWNDDTYRKWTSVFSEGSYAETDWKTGSKILFLDGKGSGLVSVIADNHPNEFISFKHLGEVKNGVEDTQSPSVKSWAGAFENYTLKSENGQTTVTIDIDLDDKWMDYFVTTWPLALAKLKEIAEQ